jgi:hypothetical protein
VSVLLFASRLLFLDQVEFHMNRSQKTVAIGAASGIVSMVMLVTVLSLVLHAPSEMDSLPDRIAFALQLNVLAVLPFFVMVITVANSRFTSDAINPLDQRETVSQEIDGRVVDNTLQQNFAFLIATLALATVLPASHLQVLKAMTAVFVLARVAFWIGYRIGPLYRAPGMAATAYLNLGALAAAIYLTFF